MLTEKEHKRYTRQITLDELGESGQHKLKQAKILVVGAGGLGCPALQYLAAAGVGKLGIVDFDTIAHSNLHRQILFNDKEVGKLKAEVAATKLEQLNPHIKLDVKTESFNINAGLDLALGYDLILDGTDNFDARFAISDTAEQLNIPMVYGAIYKFEGQVCVFNYQAGPSYRDFYNETNSVAPSCAEVGVLGVLPAIVGTYQAIEAIKIITGMGEVLSGRLMQINALTNQTSFIQINHLNRK